MDKFTRVMKSLHKRDKECPPMDEAAEAAARSMLEKMHRIQEITSITINGVTEPIKKSTLNEVRWVIYDTLKSGRKLR